MIWSSWQEFWSMGGRGPFVWGAYGVFAAAILVEILLLRAHLRRARRAAASAARARKPSSTPPIA
jgi:heme exporter protein D